MQELDLLKEQFDDKIVKIRGALAQDPEKKFYLTELTKITKVNVSTTFRIINKLVEKEFVKSVIIGRTRFYYLNNNEKTRKIVKILTLGSVAATNPVNDFIEKARPITRIKKVILKSKESTSAKLIIVGEYIPVERIQRIATEIKNKYKFDITFVELNPRQFESLYDASEFRKMGKILYENHKD